MSRLIDADLLKSDFNDVVPFDIVELPGTAVKIGLYRNSIIQQVIDEQPTVDAIEVVRCKDCVWNKQPQCPLSYTSPLSEDGEVSIWYKNKGNDYCSYGKRKDGE